MQVGSLVECKGVFEPPRLNEIRPRKGEIYTVRSFFKRNGQTYVRLYEIRNKKEQYENGFRECGFTRLGFQELQSPMNVSEIFADQLKLSNENRINK